MNLSEFIPNFIALAGTIYVAKLYIKNADSSSHRIYIYKQQLRNVYLPLFRLIEEDLYKYIDANKAKMYSEEFNIIVNKHYELVDSNLLFYIRKLSKDLRDNKDHEDSFEQICCYIDKGFTKVRKKLMLPSRGFLYRFLTDQYTKNTRQFIRDLLEYIIKGLLLLLVILFISIFQQGIIDLYHYFISLLK